MSGGLESTVISCGAKTTEFFLGDGEGAEKLREQGYEFGHRVFSLYSVRLELNRPPNSDSKGEWVTLIGPRENLEKAKDFVLSSFMPRCRLELASTHHTTSEPPSSSPSMAQNSYYDRASLHSHSSPSYSQNVSPPATISSYQSSLSHDHNRPCHGHAPSPYPPSVETRSRVEPTPTMSTIESNEQLHNAFLQIPLEQLKDLHVLLDVALKRQSLANPSQPPRGGGGGIDGRGHRLLSRSPDPREEKIDYFVNRLNYPRAKVESVIDQLGPDASIDDILGRLMRICPNDVKAPPIAGSNGGSSSSGGGGVYKQHRYSGNLGGLGGGESLSPPSQFSPPLPMPGNALSLPQPPVQDPSRLRHIVIDGSNVAMRHGSGQFYSCRGIQLAVDYFRKRGHDKITVFVPEWRKEASKPETPITEQEILHILDKEGVVKFTPSRRIRGRRVACYDDRFILDLATHEDGVIVSNDQFRDLMDDKPEWREVIETKLLPFQFVNDYFMPADDPMGKDGPTLNQLLVKDPRDVPGRQKPMHTSSTKVCPYLEKCTFGRKCKFYHPEREPRNEVALAMTTNAPQNSTSPVGSRTPNTSRSATPSPSPDKRHSRYSNSNRSSGEDLRQLHSKNGSTDDLSSYHQMSNATMDIAELQRLMQNARLQDVPGQSTANVAGNQSCYYDLRQRPHPPHSMNLPPASIHSAPVFSNNADSAASTPSEPHHPHRYTFPMAVVHQPHHVNSRTHIMTEQHRLQSQGVGGAGGVSQALGIPPLAPELDPNVMFQPHHQYSGGLSGYHQSSLLPQEAPPPPPPPHQSTNHASLQGVSSQSMFVTRDSRLPSSAHYPPAPHDLHGGSLMQAPPGFYPSSAQAQQPNGPLGYNSRGVAASGTADSNHHNPHSHSMGSSVSVPSTHSSPYHEMGGHLQHRHHSVDYGNPQNISPHRRRSSFNEGQKVNGHIPQASTTSGYGGSPYYHDYNQQQLPQQSTTTGAHTRLYLNHQSTVFTQSSQVSSQQHYHRLPAVNERPYENGAIVEPSLAKPSLFRKVVAVFPGCEETARSVMIANPHVSDFEELVRLVQQRLVTSH